MQAAALLWGAMAKRPPQQDALFQTDPMIDALALQAHACANLGSPMYASLFQELLADYRDGGRTYALLAGRSDTPLHDALPLRLAGAIHRVVLRGEDDRLARHYPSMGGTPGDDFPSDFIAFMRDHLDEIELGLATQVQTNEVGRSIVHLTLSHWITLFGVTQFDFLEIGASAGLNMNFHHFYGCCKQLRMGDPQSPLRFMGDRFLNEPRVPRTGAQVIRKRGVDVAPIDITNPEEELRLLSFVWPDQKERFTRLKAGIDIAKQFPPVIDTESADTWLQRQLSLPQERATVVFHSIVWQYLGDTVQQHMKSVLSEAGSRATAEAPLFWARMEPAGPVADVRVTVWRGAPDPDEFRLAEIGFHGQDMKWLDE